MSNVRGRTLRIFLAEGVPSGVLTAEILNWTGKVMVAPRTRLPELLARAEATKTGVYVLSGPDPEEPLRSLIYIGESDCVRDRLIKHNRDGDNDFCTRICFVVSKDENLTKTHARYLESRLIALTKAARRARLANWTAPLFDLLPESDRADMEFFIEQINLILPVLGFDFTQPTPTVPTPSGTGPTEATQPRFEMTAVGVRAEAVEANDQFIVLKGSQARLAGTSSWTSYKGLRDKLMGEGKLVESDQPNILTFVEDVPFESPSAAAAVVYAGNQNARLAWREKGSGQSYKDWQTSQLQGIAAASP